jgi:hypothetical protein
MGRLHEPYDHVLGSEHLPCCHPDHQRGLATFPRLMIVAIRIKETVTTIQF